MHKSLFINHSFWGVFEAKSALSQLSNMADVNKTQNNAHFGQSISSIKCATKAIMLAKVEENYFKDWLAKIHGMQIFLVVCFEVFGV